MGEEVPRDNAERRRIGEGAPQVRHKLRVQFDGHDVPRDAQEFAGDGPLPRTDLEHEIGAANGGATDKLPNELRVTEEVLR